MLTCLPCCVILKPNNLINRMIYLHSYIIQFWQLNGVMYGRRHCFLSSFSASVFLLWSIWSSFAFFGVSIATRARRSSWLRPTVSISVVFGGTRRSRGRNYTPCRTTRRLESALHSWSQTCHYHCLLSWMPRHHHFPLSRLQHKQHHKPTTITPALVKYMYVKSIVNRVRPDDDLIY